MSMLRVEMEGIWVSLKSDIDWIGAVIATILISLLSYVMAIVTGSATNIKEIRNIVLLFVALSLMVAFLLWMRMQESRIFQHLPRSRYGRNQLSLQPALVVSLTWGAFHPFEYLAALLLLSTVVCGILINIGTGLLVLKMPAIYLVAISSLFSAIACLLMAIISPAMLFCVKEYPAVFSNPRSSDVLYTISNLIITSSFPASEQSPANGVFNTVSQIRNSAGLTVGAVVAAIVSASSSASGRQNVLEAGYKATFWACFAALGVVAVVSWVGLKKVGRVGVKID